MSIATRPSPAPSETPETKPYWNAARRGELLIRRCRDCGEAHHYPRGACPFCMGETGWEAASGKGTIYSYSIVLKAEQPYVIAYVRLDEGPVVMTNVVDTFESAISVGAPVSLVFKETEGDGAPLPMFTPSG